MIKWDKHITLATTGQTITIEPHQRTNERGGRLVTITDRDCKITKLVLTADETKLLKEEL